MRLNHLAALLTLGITGCFAEAPTVGPEDGDESSTGASTATATGAATRPGASGDDANSDAPPTSVGDPTDAPGDVDSGAPGVVADPISLFDLACTNGAAWTATTDGIQEQSGCSEMPMPGTVTPVPNFQVDEIGVSGLQLVPGRGTGGDGDIWGDFWALDVSEFIDPELVVVLTCPVSPCNFGYQVLVWEPDATTPLTQRAGEYVTEDGLVEIRIPITVDVVDVSLVAEFRGDIMPPGEHSMFLEPAIVDVAGE